MHGPIRDRLEDLLAAAPSNAQSQGADARSQSQDVGQHLSSCAECSTELATMKAQSTFLQSLRVPEGAVEPAPGFYARVIQRIEERTKDSIWSVFLYSPFGRRVGFASLALAGILSGYVIGLEVKDGHLSGEPAISQASFFGDQAEQRDAVLVNFVSSQGSLP